MSTWADSPGTKPGNDKAVKLQKSIAAGVTMPASPRKVKTHLKGTETGCTYTPGMGYRK